jgi:hypothetical protein
MRLHVRHLHRSRRVPGLLHARHLPILRTAHTLLTPHLTHDTLEDLRADLIQECLKIVLIIRFRGSTLGMPVSHRVTEHLRTFVGLIELRSDLPRDTDALREGGIVCCRSHRPGLLWGCAWHN